MPIHDVPDPMAFMELLKRMLSDEARVHNACLGPGGVLLQALDVPQVMAQSTELPYHTIACHASLHPGCRVQTQFCQSPAASSDTCSWYKCLVTGGHPWSGHRGTRQGPDDSAVSFALKDLLKVTGALDVHVQRYTDAGYAY